jgi:hypothetical protein
MKIKEYTQLAESLKLVYDKEKDILGVVSTEPDEKAASGETYKNKKLLKNSGFRWEGGKWVTDGSNLEQAKQAIIAANKLEYMIDTLEDLEAFVHNATADPRKDKLTDRITSYIEELANETDEAAASEEIRRYLEFFAKFHQYSFHNKILIYIQKPDATRVASFRQWKKAHRSVNRGEQGISIFVPVFRKGENPLYNKNIDPDKAKPVKFTVGKVFDISQTSATSPEGEVPEEPQWWGSDEPSDVADKLYDLIVEVAKSDGIDVTNDVSKGREKGYSAGGHINITSDVAGVAKAATIAHEYAHELMHWDGKSKFYVGDGIARQRAVAELQAESVSYVVMRHFDLPCEHSTTYVALWKATKDTIHKNIKYISNVAHYIITKVERLGNKKSKTTQEDVQMMIDNMLLEVDVEIK